MMRSFGVALLALVLLGGSLGASEEYLIRGEELPSSLSVKKTVKRSKNCS